MTRLLAIAVVLSVGTASAETNLPGPSPAETNSPASIEAPAPIEAPSRPMVRNIGIAEQGDAIIVRNRKVEPERQAEPAPTTRPEQK